MILLNSLNMAIVTSEMLLGFELGLDHKPCMRLVFTFTKLNLLNKTVAFIFRHSDSAHLQWFFLMYCAVCLSVLLSIKGRQDHDGVSF